MTTLRFILLGYALMTIFIAGGLFFRRQGWSYSLLSLFALLFGLEMLDFLYGTSSNLIREYPQFYGLYHFPVGFLYGPVLWFHFRFFLNNQFRFRRNQLLHLLPALIVIISLSDIFILPGAERRDYIGSHFDFIMIFNYSRSWHILGYGAAIIYLVYRSFARLSADKKLYVITICLIYFLTAVFLSWLVGFASGWRQFIYYYLSASTIVFIIGFVVYRDPRFLQQITKKYLHSAISASEMERIARKIKRGVKTDKLFLQKDLTLRKLSDQIDEKPHKISQTLSAYMKESFHDLINRERIIYAKQMLVDKAYDHYKIEAIALDSGFNNKVTFHKAFQKFESVTPSAFRAAN